MPDAPIIAMLSPALMDKFNSSKSKGSLSAYRKLILFSVNSPLIVVPIHHAQSKTNKQKMNELFDLFEDIKKRMDIK